MFTGGDDAGISKEFRDMNNRETPTFPEEAEKNST